MTDEQTQVHPILISDDKKIVKIIPGREELFYTAEQLDLLIAHLCATRREMQPAVPMERPALGTFAAMNSPSTIMALDITGDGAIVSIRDEGRGWCHYRYFASDLRKMRDVADQILAAQDAQKRQ